jgi:predicted methyltransferase
MLKDVLKWMNDVPNLAEKINAVSDVIHNRPSPIRKYDQIYMKTGDLVYYLEILDRIIADKQALFVGDGDGIGVALVHLSNLGLLTGPRYCTVIDFDERIVEFIPRFAKEFGFEDKITAYLYNVVDPLPSLLFSKEYRFFHTNPPYSSFNEGRSVMIFIARGMELCTSAGATGCIVLPYDAQLSWTKEVLLNVQRFILSQGFIVKEAIQGIHVYHLDDNPDLRSGLLVIERIEFEDPPYKGKSVPSNELDQFFDRTTRPIPHYIRKLEGWGYKEDYTW